MQQTDLTCNKMKKKKYYAWTYYICTERSEGMSTTHVEMSGVKPLEEADMIKALRLKVEEKQGERLITLRETNT